MVQVKAGVFFTCGDSMGAPAKSPRAIVTTKRVPGTVHEIEAGIEEDSSNAARISDVMSLSAKRSRRDTDRFLKWYRSLFDDAPVMYVVTHEHHRTPFVVQCNELFARTLGFPRHDVIGRSLLNFLSDGVQAWPSMEGATREVGLCARDGRVVRALMRALPEVVEEDEAGGHRVTFVEITEARTTERQRSDGEDLNRTLLERMPDTLVLIRRENGKLTFEPARRTTDLELDPTNELESRHLALPHEVSRLFERPFDLACLGATSAVQYQLEVDGETRHLEARLVDRGGGEQVLAIVRDVTAQKETERQIQESQRLEALGRLAGGISHDFNNLLTIIAGNAELALLDQSTGETPGGEVQEIVTAARRASELTRQLLAFSSRQVLEPVAVDLNDLVSGTERMLRRLIGEDISLRVRLEEGLSSILADPGRIEQVIMNLAVNARDAMPDGGILSFETETSELYETRVGENLRIPSGHYVRLTVSDTGIGMDDETRSHIFEPFFTTKVDGAGTGLGLSTVYGIVKQSGGYIWVYSEVEQGTVFKIYFPRCEASESVPAKETMEIMGPASGETVLLVEDEQGVLDLARSILKRGGYNVIVATNGTQALNLADDKKKTIDVVATDVVMPGMSGPELAKALEAIRPGVKILYMSGYGEETILRYGIRDASAHFLEKPYSSVALLNAVRRAVDSVPPVGSTMRAEPRAGR